MSPFRAVAQRAFQRGLIAAQGLLAQIPASLPRISNLLYNVRGALRTCDGTLEVSHKIGGPVAGAGTGSDVAVAGGIAWSNPGNITTENAAYASVTLNPGGATSTIYPTTLLNGWGPNAHVGAYEGGIDQGYSFPSLDGGTTYAYSSPALAYDANTATYASCAFLHTHKYAGCVWSFGSNPAMTAKTLNILSQVPPSSDFDISPSGWKRSASIHYSLDGGTTWSTVYNSSTRAKQWDTISLADGQNCSQVQVMAFMDAHDDMAHYVFEINITGQTGSPTTKTSDLLEATNFSFTTPATPVSGIQVEVKGLESANPAGSTMTVQMLKAGALVGTAKTTQLPTSNGFITLGSNSDLWGTTWAVADISNTNFGVAIQATAATASVTWQVDFIRITVFIGQTTSGPLTAIHWYQPAGARGFYVAVEKDLDTHLGAPTNLAVTDGGAGGTLAAAHYYYKVTALDGAGGESLASNEGDIVNPGNEKNKLDWDAVTNATGYNVYRSITTGTEQLLSANVQTNTYTDDGSATIIPQSLPTIDTTQVCRVLKLTVPTYSNADTLKIVPADNLAPPDTDGGTGGSYGGSIDSSGSTVVPDSSPVVPAAGGVVGNVTPIPQLLTFADKVVCCLGNGYNPLLSDGTSGNTVAITNTFVQSLPTWFANAAIQAGDIFAPTTPNGHIYKATQGGVTNSTTEPVWPTTKDKTIADGSVVWQEAGSDAAGTAPPGAAHGIAHAGALWLFNTWPSNTANGLDGPSALRMSDINNPTSWNPINAAFIGKDDGTQGMGLASFTIAEAGIPPQAALVAFKEFSTYMINGVFGSSNFAIQQAQTDMGCIAPRTIQFLPGFGIARLTHLGIAIFDGVRDRLISEEIRPYLFGGQADINSLDWTFAYFSKGFQVVNPPMYCIAIPVLTQGQDGRLTRILCYDLVLKAWTVVDLVNPIAVGVQVRAHGTIPLSVFGGWGDGIVRRWQAGDFDWDGTAISWSARTPEVFGATATDRVYFRRLLIRGSVPEDQQTLSISVTGTPINPNPQP